MEVINFGLTGSFSSQLDPEKYEARDGYVRGCDAGDFRRAKIQEWGKSLEVRV